MQTLNWRYLFLQTQEKSPRFKEMRGNKGSFLPVNHDRHTVLQLSKKHQEGALPNCLEALQLSTNI